MTVSIDQIGKGRLAIDIVGGTSVAAGGQGEVDNPEGVPLVIVNTTLVVKTPSTGASNLSCGIAASGGAFTDIINALAMNGVAANTPYNGVAQQVTAKTAITAPALWTAALKLGITASADMTGMTGTLYVEYLRID